MELDIEQKKNLARLSILRQLARRVGDLYEKELRSELKKIGRTGRRFERADIIAQAAALERADTIDIMARIAEGEIPDFSLVPDLPFICSFEGLLGDLYPASFDLLQVVDTMKTSSQCRNAIEVELLPAIPRPLPEFDPDDDTLYFRTADGFEPVDEATLNAMLHEGDFEVRKVEYGNADA